MYYKVHCIRYTICNMKCTIYPIITHRDKTGLLVTQTHTIQNVQYIHTTNIYDFHKGPRLCTHKRRPSLMYTQTRPSLMYTQTQAYVHIHIDAGHPHVHRHSGPRSCAHRRTHVHTEAKNIGLIIHTASEILNHIYGTLCMMEKQCWMM